MVEVVITPKPPSGEPEPLFQSPKMKLERARTFMGELEAEFARYRDNDPLSVVPAILNGEPHSYIEWKGAGLLPGALIGDTVHSLRTALDQMASELARINGKTDRDVYFPFSDGLSTFEAAIRKRRFEKAGKDAVELLRTFTPYRGGNDDLRALHDLDIQDKHTGIVVTDFLNTLEVIGTEEQINNGTCEVKMEFRWVFPDGSHLSGREVISTLKQLVEIVDGIIEAFASLVAARVLRGAAVPPPKAAGRTPACRPNHVSSEVPTSSIYLPRQFR
jgi:hypothetical protein